MRTGLVLLALMTVTAPVCAQSADIDVCITIDEGRDMLSSPERIAALLLVERQFELAGRRVVSVACAVPYTISHIRLGNTIVVTLMGATGQVEGTARDLDDLPTLYNQIVQSMVTGRPMTGFNLVDRRNVTASQASQQRVQSDRVWYARTGYGGVFGERTYGGPAQGFGYRVEVDAFAVDVSFLNFQVRPEEDSGMPIALSEVKFEGLYFLKPEGNASAYIGGGLSWGGSQFGGSYVSDVNKSSWHGGGLQGELTVGREIRRASTLRMFVQADTVLPFYKVTSKTVFYGKAAPPPITERRYAPSVAVSLGLGWQRNRRPRP